MASEVRPMTAADIETVRAIGIAAGERFGSIDDPRIAACADDPPFSAEELTTFIAEQRAFVATDGDEVVGFLVLEQLADAAHIEEVAVSPEHERRGHGTALLDTANEWARALHLAALTLTTFRDVPWNRPYYERRGFTVLDDADLTPELRARRAEEHALGLLAELRVVMRKIAS
jgi:GNAT superfamily N-acetyltransferase